MPGISNNQGSPRDDISNKHFVEHLASEIELATLHVEIDEGVLDEKVFIEAANEDGLRVELGAHGDGAGSGAELEKGGEGEGEWRGRGERATHEGVKDEGMRAWRAEGGGGGGGADEGGPEEGVGGRDLGKDGKGVGIRQGTKVDEAAEKLGNEVAALVKTKAVEKSVGFVELRNRGGGGDGGEEEGFELAVAAMAEGGGHWFALRGF